MTKQSIKCNDCQKEITSGKYYIFRRNISVIEGNFEKYCPPCAEKEKEVFKKLIEKGFVTITEAEIGNKVDDDILEFEEQWKKYDLTNVIKKGHEVEAITVEWIQEAQKELEPYLQKLDIVEKSFGGGNSLVYFYYWFTQSAHDDNYRQEVANKTVAEIFGEEPTSEVDISISKTGIDGKKLKIGNKEFRYYWVDADYHLLRFELNDRKLALQSHRRALAIKEKELKGDEKPIENNKFSEFNRPQEQDAPNSTTQPKSTNWTLIIILSVAGIAIIAGLFFYFWKRKKTKSN